MQVTPTSPKSDIDFYLKGRNRESENEFVLKKRGKILFKGRKGGC